MKIERSLNPILFFSKEEKKDVVEAIQVAEKKTSGEIRVHLERKLKDDHLKHAESLFEKLGMTQTEKRNSVLIVLGVKSKRFAVLADQGIHEKVGQDFWEELVGRMQAKFREDRFAEGLTEAIASIGKKLSQYFPYERDDVNELPDEISYSL